MVNHDAISILRCVVLFETGFEFALLLRGRLYIYNQYIHLYIFLWALFLLPNGFGRAEHVLRPKLLLP